nr:hypothetical protein [Tanacetum cinerariifolium]
HRGRWLRHHLPGRVSDATAQNLPRRPGDAGAQGRPPARQRRARLHQQHAGEVGAGPAGVDAVRGPRTHRGERHAAGFAGDGRRGTGLQRAAAGAGGAAHCLAAARRGRLAAPPHRHEHRAGFGADHAGSGSLAGSHVLAVFGPHRRAGAKPASAAAHCGARRAGPHRNHGVGAVAGPRKLQLHQSCGWLVGV